MYNLETFNAQLVSVMNVLANDVIAEITLSKAVHVDSGSNGEDEGKLDTLVRIKCIEASNTIIKLFKEITSRHDDPEEPRHSDPEGVNDTGASSGEDVCESLQDGRDSTSAHGERSSPVPPREEDSTSPAVDLDHHYIRSSATFSIMPRRGKDRSTAREARRKKRRSVAEPCVAITKSSRVQHVCRHCGTLFSAVIDLRDHERHVHQVVERPYSCDYCEKTFSHKPHRDRHHRLHRGERMFQCEICEKSYTTSSQLKTHKLTHSEKSFICDICGNGFYQSGHLKRHKLVHKDLKQEARPFCCDICGKGFNQAENLKKHKITHTDEKQLCAICGKSYRCLSNHMINKHAHDITNKKVALNKDVITCDVCGKKYLHASQYKLHKMTHTGEKPYHCDICGKSFRLKDTLKDHRYIHTGERPYKCTTCGKTFPSTPSYRRHTSIHTGEMPYHCKVCGKRFRLLTFLKAHQKTQGHLRLKMKEAPAEDS